MCWICSLRDPGFSAENASSADIFLPFKKTVNFSDPPFLLKPVYTSDQIVSQLYGGSGVTPDAWTGTNITYSIPLTAPQPFNPNKSFATEIDNFQPQQASKAPR